MKTTWNIQQTRYIPSGVGGNIDSYTHLRGESIYLDDIPLQAETLFAAVFDSPSAHGKIISIDSSEASALPGVKRIFTAKDILGENQIGGIIPDEEFWHRIMFIFAECRLLL